MKRFKNYLLVLLVATTVGACGQYDEGPGLSLRSKKARVANDWKVAYAIDLQDQVEITADFTGDHWEFSKEGVFAEKSNGVVEKTGTWEFLNDKDEIGITTPDGLDVYQILKLKEKEMWLKNLEEEIHLVTN